MSVIPGKTVNTECKQCDTTFTFIKKGLWNGKILSGIYCSEECKEKFKANQRRESQIQKNVHPPRVDPELQAKLLAENYRTLEPVKMVKSSPANVARTLYDKKRPQRLAPVTSVKYKQNYIDNEPVIYVNKPKSLFTCPEPTKRVFASYEVAQSFINLHHTGDTKIHPYECKCGELHIGH